MVNMQKVQVRLIANQICEQFEDLLEKHDITIPDEDREGNEDEARLYGMTYAELEDRITSILMVTAEMIKRDDVELLDEY
jgi:hypothetical protein